MMWARRRQEISSGIGTGRSRPSTLVGRGPVPTWRVVSGWLAALLLVFMASPALGEMARSSPDAATNPPPAPVELGDGGLGLRLVDDPVLAPDDDPTSTTGTGPTSSTAPPTTVPTTAPPTTVPPTTVPPTTVPPTTVPPTTVPPTTVPPTTVPPTTAPPTTAPPTTAPQTTSPPTTVPPTTAPATTAPPATDEPATVPPRAIVTTPPSTPPAPVVREPAASTTTEATTTTTSESEETTTTTSEPIATTTTEAADDGAEEGPREMAAPADAEIPPPGGDGEVDRVLPTGVGLGGGEASRFGTGLPSPATGPLDVQRVGVNTALAAVLSLLMILPAELFNATLRVNYDQVLRPLERFREAGGAALAALGRLLPASRWGRGVAFALVAALANSAIDPQFGFGWGSVRMVLAQTLALFASTFAVCGLSLLIGRRFGVSGQMALRPGGLVLCFVAVLLSRMIGVSPGFLYGMVVGLQFNGPMPLARVGRIALAQAGFLLTLGVSSWLLLGVLHDAFPGSQPGFLPALGSEVLTSLAVGTTTGLVLSMMPLTYLRGEKLFVWNKPLWVVTYGIVFFAFLSIAVNPVFGRLENTNSVTLWAGVYAAVGVVSVLFWLRFRNTDHRSTVDRLTEALPRL